MASYMKHPVTLSCRHCKQQFETRYKQRKYCSAACKVLAVRECSDRHEEKDPTPEQIAEMCRKIRTGEIVIDGGRKNYDNYDPSACRGVAYTRHGWVRNRNRYE